MRCRYRETRNNGEFQRQIEALQRILTNMNVHDKWVMLDGPEGKPREIRLQLNRGPQKLKPKQAAKSDEAPITRDTRRR